VFKRKLVMMTGVGLRLLACWDCGFKSRRGHRYLSLEECCVLSVQVSAMGWSLVQRCPTECGVSECDREASTTGRSATGEKSEIL